jgi:hypothetical protein
LLDHEALADVELAAILLVAEVRRIEVRGEHVRRSKARPKHVLEVELRGHAPVYEEPAGG